MKISTTLLMTLAASVIIPAAANADDEFGARFSNATPSALMEETAGPDDALAPNVEPAAGAEDQDQQTDNQTPAAAPAIPQTQTGEQAQTPTGAGYPKPLDSQ